MAALMDVIYRDPVMHERLVVHRARRLFSGPICGDRVGVGPIVPLYEKPRRCWRCLGREDAYNLTRGGGDGDDIEVPQ